jgi:CheY-like chemotaxis protein
MANVLQVGTNEAVLATRKAILEKAGHSVTLARDLRELISACEGSSFDIGIIGQAMPTMEKLRVSDTLRNRCEGIRLLEFHDAIKPDVETADAHLRVADTTPASFLDIVNELARRRRKKGKASE